MFPTGLDGGDDGLAESGWSHDASVAVLLAFE
jgi:hypothetical protein